MKNRQRDVQIQPQGVLMNEILPDNPPIDVKRLFNSLVTQLIRQERDLWNETKSDFSSGLMPDLYSNSASHEVQASAAVIIRSRSAAERQELETLALSKIPPDALDRSCAALMVGEWMVRANRAVSRHGYDG